MNRNNNLFIFFCCYSKRVVHRIKFFFKSLNSIKVNGGFAVYYVNWFSNGSQSHFLSRKNKMFLNLKFLISASFFIIILIYYYRLRKSDDEFQFLFWLQRMIWHAIFRFGFHVRDQFTKNLYRKLEPLLTSK